MAKIPLVRWKEFQRRRATAEELARWLSAYGNPNVAVVTGAVSGLVVIDCDTPEAVAAFEPMLERPTTTVRTGRGRHFYFQHPGTVVRNATTLLDSVDVRGDGGYVLAPDSLHRNGRLYEWVRPPWELPPAPLPERLQAILAAANYRSAPADTGSQTRSEGWPEERHSAEREAGRFAGGTGERPRGLLMTYSLVALKDEIRRLHALPLAEGNNRERLLMASAFRMGQLVPYGYLNPELVMGELLAVWCDRWGKPLDRGVRTIGRGLSDGERQPRRISQLARYNRRS